MHAPPASPLARTVEPNLSVFSAAEIRVVRAGGLQGGDRFAARRGGGRVGATARGARRTCPGPRAAQVLLPVGEAPEDVFHRYAQLIVRHRQVRVRAPSRRRRCPPPPRWSRCRAPAHACCLQAELTNVRSFYKEAQKSPFKFFPWKTGNLHFKFVPVSRRRRWVLSGQGGGNSMHVHCRRSWRWRPARWPRCSRTAARWG